MGQNAPIRSSSSTAQATWSPIYQEFQNVYNSIAQIPNATYKTSSMTLQGITVDSITVNKQENFTGSANFFGVVNSSMQINGSAPKLTLYNTSSSDLPFIQGGNASDGYLWASGGTNRGVKLAYNTLNRALTVDGTSGAVSFLGTSTNDNANPGDAGEVLRSYVGTPQNMASDIYQDITSLAVTAGDWALCGNWGYTDNGAGGWNKVDYGFGTAAGSSSTGLSFGDSAQENAGGSATADADYTICDYRVQLVSTTNYYMKARSHFTSGTVQVYGRMSARRPR